MAMAHLETKATRNDDEERWRWRWELNLTRRLYERGYERRDVIALVLC